MWSVYIIQCRDQTLYTGITNNLTKRLEMHESGQAAKYTKGRGPFKLVYQEFFENRSISTKRESEIKKFKKEDKNKLIEGYRSSLRNT
jgi:putative endonuclease